MGKEGRGRALRLIKGANRLVRFGIGLTVSRHATFITLIIYCAIKNEIEQRS